MISARVATIYLHSIIDIAAELIEVTHKSVCFRTCKFWKKWFMWLSVRHHIEASSTFSLSPLSDGCTGGPSFAMERGLWADWEAISSKVSRTCSARTSSLSLIWTLIYKYNQHQFLLCCSIDRIAIFQNICCNGVHKSLSNIIDLPLNLAGVDYPNPWR